MKRYPPGWWVETTPYRSNNPNDGWVIKLYLDGKPIMSGTYPTLDDVADVMVPLKRLIDEANGRDHREVVETQIGKG